MRGSRAGPGAESETAGDHMQVVSLSISDEAHEDKEFLEDLVIAAVNDGMRKAQDNLTSSLSALTAGLPIPPGLLGM